MRLKKYLIVMAAVVLFTPMGCSHDELLDQTNPNDVPSLVFWRNAEDAQLAINGMFHPITGTFFWGRIIHTGALLRSDEFNVIPNSTNTLLSTFQGTPGVGRFALEPYEEGFKAIFRANAILENVDENNVPDEATRNSILGQAYFMRAFAYWYMVNMYGNVPAGQEGGIPLVLKTPDISNMEDVFPEAATALAVWDQIIDDLTEAEQRLPAAWEGEDIGRATSWAAKALKGKSYLFRSGLLGVDEYAQAEASLREVANGPFALLPAAQFSDNFTQNNENNMESVFELQFHPVGNGNFIWGTDIPGTGTMANFVIDYAPPSQSPDQGHVINPWVKALFEANNDEIRRNATLAYDYPGSTVNAGEPFTTGLADDIEQVAKLTEIPQNEGLEAIFSRKYSGLELPQGETGFLGDNYGPNWRVIRYADVLLMLAEAINEQAGRTAEAEVFLNEVRDRAGISPKTGLSQEAMRQAIMDERTLELAGEGHRFFDLLRWGTATQFLGIDSEHQGPHPKSISGGTFTSGRDELIWIPQSETQSNLNLKQNPGY